MKIVSPWNNGNQATTRAIKTGWSMPYVGRCSTNRFQTASFKVNFGDPFYSKRQDYEHTLSLFFVFQKDEVAGALPTTPVNVGRHSCIQLIVDLFITTGKEPFRDTVDPCFPLHRLYLSKEWRGVLDTLPERPPFDPDPVKNMLEDLQLTGIIDIMMRHDNYTPYNFQNPRTLPRTFVKCSDVKLQWHRPGKTDPKDILALRPRKFMDWLFDQVETSDTFLNHYERMMYDFKINPNKNFSAQVKVMLRLLNSIMKFYLGVFMELKILSRPDCFATVDEVHWGYSRYSDGYSPDGMRPIACDSIPEGLFDASLVSYFVDMCCSSDEITLKTYAAGNCPCVAVQLQIPGWSGTLILPMCKIGELRNVGKVTDRQFESEELYVKSSIDQARSDNDYAYGNRKNYSPGMGTSCSVM